MSGARRLRARPIASPLLGGVAPPTFDAEGRCRPFLLDRQPGTSAQPTLLLWWALSGWAMYVRERQHGEFRESIRIEPRL